MASKKTDVIEVTPRKIVRSPKHFLVEIRGIAGLLMNKQPDLSVPETSKSKQAKVDLKERELKEWRKKLYVRDDIGVYIPGENIHESMKEGTKYWGQKIPGSGNKTYTDLLVSGVVVEDMPLGNGKPLLASNSDVITPFGKNCNGNPSKGKGSGCLVYKIRPHIRPWGGQFLIHVFDERLNRDILETIFSYAGTFKGLCDWRPNFGRFELINISEVQNAEFNF